LRRRSGLVVAPPERSPGVLARIPLDASLGVRG
jgi:hypothetical protein